MAGKTVCRVHFIVFICTCPKPVSGSWYYMIEYAACWSGCWNWHSLTLQFPFPFIYFPSIHSKLQLKDVEIDLIWWHKVSMYVNSQICLTFGEQIIKTVWRICIETADTACLLNYFHFLCADYLPTNSPSVILSIYMTIEAISYNSALSEWCASWSFCTTVCLCGCRQSSFVTVWADDFDIWFCGMTVLKCLWTFFRMNSEIISCYFWKVLNVCCVFF
jgi:hypothetical protein